MFSMGSSSSISLATVTPSLVMAGAPNFFSSTTLRPLGPKVTLTAFARVSTPFFILLRASISKKSCFAIIILIDLPYEESNVKNDCINKLNDSKNVGLPHDKEIVTFDLDLRTGIFAIQDGVTDLHGHWLILFTGTRGHNRTALRLFLGRVRNDNATGSFFFSGSWLHYYPISKRGNV